MKPKINHPAASGRGMYDLFAAERGGLQQRGKPRGIQPSEIKNNPK
jgi:hypothetical protein